MSVYQEILDLAHQQSAALARGELEQAVRLLAARQPLVERAGPASVEDADVIHQILRLDRRLSGAIRERMLALRDQAQKTRHGRLALSRYAPPTAHNALLLDSHS